MRDPSPRLRRADDPLRHARNSSVAAAEPDPSAGDRRHRAHRQCPREPRLGLKGGDHRMKHLLSLEKLPQADMERILADAPVFKKERGRHAARPLAAQTWAMIFNKSSTRTRVSFEVGIRELGGEAMFLNSADIQMGRGEPIKDTARVLGRMIHGAVIRTYAQSDVEEFAQHAGVPTVNALTDQEHPCQVLSDIFTFQERRGPIQGKVVTFIGDGACNMPMSWIFAAIKLGFELRIAAPAKYQPSIKLERLGLAAGSARLPEE